jgi:hypothetical protein
MMPSPPCRTLAMVKEWTRRGVGWNLATLEMGAAHRRQVAFFRVCATAINPRRMQHRRESVISGPCGYVGNLCWRIARQDANPIPTRFSHPRLPPAPGPRVCETRCVRASLFLATSCDRPNPSVSSRHLHCQHQGMCLGRAFTDDPLSRSLFY